MVIFIFMIGRTAMADFYTWKNERGEIQITDYPPPTNAIVRDIQFHQYRAEEPSTAQGDESPAARKADVLIYTKNDCPDCDKARDFLNSQKVPFTEYNMDTDANAAIKRKEIDDGEDVPFAIINRNHVYGFSESVYDRVLKMEP
jgi:glutaredoxin